MRLAREEIERRDFDRTIGGYDPDQVNARLHAIAVAVADLFDRLADANQELPQAARERIEGMGEVVRRRAHEEAERLLREAREEATRIRADAERQHAERVRSAADELSRILDQELAEPPRVRRFERTTER